MNALGYMDILQTRVLPWLDQTGEKDRLIVVQDNARYHTTPDIFQFCNENGINVLQWPPYSPDLNVIENFWALLKRYIRKRRPRNIEQLMDFMNDFQLLATFYKSAVRKSVSFVPWPVWRSDGQPRL